MKVHIMELADRYIIVNDETGMEIEEHSIGFSSKSSAVEYAEDQGWEVVP